MSPFLWCLALAGALLLVVVIYDLTQRSHAILRNFPLLGHFRYLLESVGPELRQYIVTSNDEERPFSRDQRSWIYASSKKQNNYAGFGTDNDLEHAHANIIIKHSAFPVHEPHEGSPDYDAKYAIACAKVIGEHRGRTKAYRPESVYFISAMSYGSLSAPAVEAINRGVGMAGGLHNTGEGSICCHHDHGGSLIWQIGTGYYGCRDAEGKLDIAALAERAAKHDVRLIEIKLSQGAKPGRGGVLPAAKITPEIAAIRGIPEGKDCISPSGHTAFHDVDSMLEVVEAIAAATGLPVGIKSAVGETKFWEDLAEAMKSGERGVDFINIDGGEGGTGAAPLVFSDNVSLPFKIGFRRVRTVFEEAGIADNVVW
ncbi:MAG: glutamate synthase domain-containing protein 2, partial [Flavobacteriales bacterium]